MMDEEFNSDAIDTAFASFRNGPELPAPIGAAAARATVRHRRRVRAGVTTGLTALLIAAPVAAYAAGVIGTNGPPDESATQPPTPAASAPAASPSPTPSASSAAPPPDGRIDIETLKGAKLSLPGWPHVGKDACPAGERQFTDGSVGTPDIGGITYQDSVFVDVDADGTEETVAVFTCQVAQSPEYQVVAFDRDRSGKIVTIGSVMATRLEGYRNGRQPEIVYDLRADGTAVQVEVGDIITCCGMSGVVTPQRQWRTYSLVDGAFRQTGGPATFEANSTYPGDGAAPPGPSPGAQTPKGDLLIVSSSMSGTTTGETFAGTIKITIRNDGPESVNPVVGFALPKGAELKYVPMGCERDDDAVIGNRDGETGAAYLCMMGPTAPGEDVALGGPFEITAPAATFPVGAEKVAYVEVRASGDPNVWPAAGDALPETDYGNNLSTVRFTVG